MRKDEIHELIKKAAQELKQACFISPSIVVMLSQIKNDMEDIELYWEGKLRDIQPTTTKDFGEDNDLMEAHDEGPQKPGGKSIKACDVETTISIPDVNSLSDLAEAYYQAYHANRNLGMLIGMAIRENYIEEGEEDSIRHLEKDFDKNAYCFLLRAAHLGHKKALARVELDLPLTMHSYYDGIFAALVDDKPPVALKYYKPLDEIAKRHFNFYKKYKGKRLWDIRKEQAQTCLLRAAHLGHGDALEELKKYKIPNTIWQEYANETYEVFVGDNLSFPEIKDLFISDEFKQLLTEKISFDEEANKNQVRLIYYTFG